MKVCEVCGKGRTSGNNVSHSMRHTKRTFDANIQKVDVELDGKKGIIYLDSGDYVEIKGWHK